MATLPKSSPLRRRRRRHPRPLHRLPPGEGALRARSRLRGGRRRPREVAAGRRSLRNRLRGRPQQLLPAGDERAHAGLRRGLGVRPGRLRVQRGRLHRARPAGAGAGPRGDVRAPGADRVPLDLHHRRGRGRPPHEGALPRLARAGRHRLPARVPGRLRVQPGLRRRARREGPRPGRRDPHGRRGDRARAGAGRRRHGCRDGPGPDRGRRAARHRSGPVGEELLAHARPPDGDRHPHAVGRRREGPADVDVLEPAGGRDHRRPAHVRDRRRERAAGHPPGHGRAARGRRRPAHQRRALGDLLQARPPRRPGRCRAARRSRATSSSTRIRPRPTSTPASRTCGARPFRTP